MQISIKGNNWTFSTVSAETLKILIPQDNDFQERKAGPFPTLPLRRKEFYDRKPPVVKRMESPEYIHSAF